MAALGAGASAAGAGAVWAAACSAGAATSAPTSSALIAKKRRQNRVMARAFDVTVEAEIRVGALSQHNVRATPASPLGAKTLQRLHHGGGGNWLARGVA